MSTAYVIDVPATFASDHVDRELPTGKLVKRTAKLWTFMCNQEELIEWYSDAEFYSDTEHWRNGNCPEEMVYLMPIIKSAQRTLKRLRPHFEHGPQSLRIVAKLGGLI